MDSPTISSQPADTNGWDTVYALKFPDVNAEIVRKKSSPKCFHHDIENKGGVKTTLDGKFGDWQLVVGGDGKDLHMSLPIPSSTVVGGYFGSTAQTCTHVTAIIEVNLLWVNSDNAAANKQELITNVSSADATQPPVSVLVLDFSKDTTGGLDEIGQSIYKGMLLDWLSSAIKEFKHVFSMITLNTILDGMSGFEWMVPTDTLYAVTDVADNLEDSIFSVLCMTGNRPNPEAHQVSPYAIPPSTDPQHPINSVFLISPARLLENMMLPGVPLMFKDSPALSSFTVDATTIKNNVQLQFPDQDLYDKENVYVGTAHPVVEAGNFIIELVDNVINFVISGMHFEWKPGVTVTVDHTSKATLVLNPDRKFKLTVQNGAFSSFNVEISDGLSDGMIAASIGLAVAGAALGGFLGGASTAATSTATEAVTVTVADGVEDALSNIEAEAVSDAEAQVGGAPGKFSNFFSVNWAKMLGGMIGGAIGGSTAAIPGILTKLANDGAHYMVPTLDLFGTAVMKPITWPNMDTTGDIVVGGRLNGALQIALYLKPLPAAPAAA